jgi:hypothetical protein
MARTIQKLPNPSGVGADQTATLSIPTGPTYHQLIVKAVNNGSAVTDWSVFDEVRLSLNGRVKLRASGAELAMLADYYGYTRAAGVLPIVFSRDYLRTAIQEDYLSWGTADQQSFSLEIDVAASAISPSVEVLAWRSAGTPLGQHVEVGKSSFQVSSTGEYEFTDFPKVRGGLMALHIDTDAISAAETLLNNVPVVEGPTAVLQAVAEGKARPPRAWQTGFTHLDYHVADRLDDVVPTNVQDLRLRLEMTGGTGSRRMLWERVVGNPPSRS